MSLKIDLRYEKNDNIISVIPEGDIDIYTSHKFKETVLNSYEKNKGDVSIDGSNLEYVDSTGLGALISILKKVKETDNKVIISNLKPNIKKLFSITELDKVFTIRGEGND
ncbi:MAG: STAS domain-containing protein [Tissierellaceae bacterium]|nr:STAS domain-containing protein [Tissierellaceae bacterium]